MDMLGEIGDKIDKMQDLMIYRFDRMEYVVQSAAARSVIMSATAEIDSAIKYINIFMQAHGEERKIAIADIKTLSVKDIRVAASKINSSVSNMGLGNNIYDADFESSYGDKLKINEIGSVLNYYLSAANIIDSIIHCINTIPEDVLFSIDIPPDTKPQDCVPDVYLDSIDNAINNSSLYYKDLLESNISKWLLSLQRCVSENARHIEKYFLAEISPQLDAKDHKGSANSIIDHLSKKWEWLDFFTVVYKNVNGYESHIMQGLEGDPNEGHVNGYLNFPNHTIKNGTVNLFIAWIDKSNEAKGQSRNTKSSISYKELTPFDPWHKDSSRRSIWDSSRKTKIYNKNVGGFLPLKTHSHVTETDDLRTPINSLIDNPPSPTRFVWMAIKKLNAQYAYSNKARFFWADEKYLDIAIFE